MATPVTVATISQTLSMLGRPEERTQLRQMIWKYGCTIEYQGDNHWADTPHMESLGACRDTPESLASDSKGVSVNVYHQKRVNSDVCIINNLNGV